MKIKAQGKEFTLPKMTPDQLNQIFGAGNWQILESASLPSLTSNEKARKLGLDPSSQTWKELKGLIEVVLKATKDVQEFLKANEINVASGFYIGNPKQQ